MDVNIGKLCMCEETDIELVLAAMKKNFKPQGI